MTGCFDAEHAAACGDELVYFFGGLSPSSQSDEECKGEVEPERLVCSNILCAGTPSRVLRNVEMLCTNHLSIVYASWRVCF